MSVIEGQDELQKDYPLLHSVARAATAVRTSVSTTLTSPKVPRHHARVVRIEYTGEGEPQTTLLLAGKGVTYDSGGVDIKTGGSMHGMSRDKVQLAFFFSNCFSVEPQMWRDSCLLLPS